MDEKEVKDIAKKILDLSKELKGSCDEVTDDVLEKAGIYLKCVLSNGLGLYGSYMYNYAHDFVRGVEGIGKVNVNAVAQSVLEDFGESRFLIVAGMNDKRQLLVSMFHGKVGEKVGTPAVRRDLANMLGDAVYMVLMELVNRMTDGMCSKCPRRNECDFFVLVEFLFSLYERFLEQGVSRRWLRFASETALNLALVAVAEKAINEGKNPKDLDILTL